MDKRKEIQRNALIGLVIGLTIGLILDIKNKGLIYRLFTAKRVQS